jgi:L-asparaginase II
LIGGTGRAVSELTATVPGLVCKEGAEGVWAAALPDGRAFAAKLDDGGARALPPLLTAALCHWGVDNEVIGRWSAVAVLGGGAPVGTLRWSDDLRTALAL